MKIFDLSYLEDVSEAPSIVGGNSLSIKIKNGKADIQSKGFKVVKKEVKGGKGISITATSAGSSATKVSITTSSSTLDTELDDDELEDWDE